MPWVSGLWILLPWVFSLVILILWLCFPLENPFGRLCRSFIVSVFRCYGFLSPNLDIMVFRSWYHDVALFCLRMRWVDSLVYTQKTNAKLSSKIYRYTNLCNDLLHKFGINQGNIIKLYYVALSATTCGISQYKLHRSEQTAWKVSTYGVFSSPYFRVFGLNTEKYGVLGHFSRSDRLAKTGYSIVGNTSKVLLTMKGKSVYLFSNS